MVELNQRDRTIKIKIAYYGPALGGKTTNLRLLHEGARGEQRGELLSVNSAQDRTILFDFMPLKASGFRGFDVRLQLVAVPGQVMYSASRRVILGGVDAIVFVANSAADRLRENSVSHEEMCRHLIGHQIDPHAIPMVFQYNKRDLPQVQSVEALDGALNARRVPSLEAVASEGKGVLETFGAALLMVIQDLSLRYRTLQMSEGQTSEEWVHRTLDGVFGKRSLALRPSLVDVEEGFVIEDHIVPDSGPPSRAREAAASSGHRRVVLQPWEATPPSPLLEPGGAGNNEALVGVYAEASTELAIVAAELREERDEAQRRLEQMQQLVDAGSLVASPSDHSRGLGRALEVFAQAGRCAHASFLLPDSPAMFRALLLPALEHDPLLSAPTGLGLIEMFRNDEEPSILHGADMADVARVLEAASPPMAALVVVPLRAPAVLLGFLMLYYPPDAALPSRSVLEHLGLMARSLRAPLELAVERARANQGSSPHDRSGTATRALPGRGENGGDQGGQGISDP